MGIYRLQYFDIILFAILAGYLGIKLYRTLGTKTKLENKPLQKNNKPSDADKAANIIVEEKDKEERSYESGSGLEHLKNLYKGFSESDFLAGANKAFEIILKAKNEGNKKLLISLLEDKAFRIYEKEILEREMNGNSIETTSVRVKNSQINDVKVDDNIAYISVDFDAETGVLMKASDSSVVSDTTKKLERLQSKWVFCRPLDADSPNWKLYSV
tara:strand:- start:191 stop:832 length:642 start_codon:yes stop_codon:yes gene_type:complete